MSVRSLLRQLQGGPVAPRLRRFVVVGTVAAGLQMVLLWTFVDVAGANYLLGAVVAIETTILFQYVLNNAWTFRASRHDGVVAYLAGLARTNVVRGTAIPLQLGALFVLVEWQSVPYLSANAAAIVVSGTYRYVLDARWTWG
jgi:putative flippase GtrA